MPEIATILRNEAETHGAIPFSRFMELALYCPELGYYEREQAPGRTGDFFTSVSVGPLFGRLLAAQFTRWLTAFPTGRLQLVEAGAHDGRLALDILSWLEHNHGPEWPRIEYWILEPSARRRSRQAATLARFAQRLRWFPSPAALDPRSVHGVLFSNELLDAFPVTRLRWKARRQSWIEMGVATAENRLVWAELATPNRPIAPLLAEAGLTVPPELAAVLPDGFTLDLAAGASAWWDAAAQALGRGTLLTIDYGHTAEGLLHPARQGGTLRAYRQHRIEADVLANPGQQDLTSHVNFTQLQRAGEAAGLATEPLCTQAQFLLPIAAWVWKGRCAPNPGESRQLHTLTHPEHLGQRFQVFRQQRGEAVANLDASCGACPQPP